MSLSEVEMRARYMSEAVGIHLTESQLDEYVSQRQVMPPDDHQEHNGLKPWNLCDQALLDTVLFPEQSVIFRSKYPKIFPPQSTGTEKPEGF